MSPAVACRALELDYGSGTRIGPLTISIPQGACVALVGENGAGKSSFIVRRGGGVLKRTGARNLSRPWGGVMILRPGEARMGRTAPAAARLQAAAGAFIFYA